MNRRLLVFFALLWLTPALSASERPRLVVMLVFDQMRGDYLARWESLFVEGGLKRLMTESAWFDNCHYSYCYTLTGPGHATISTGCLPSQHGIIANEWYDRKLQKEVNCVGSDRHEQIPPALPDKEGKLKKGGVSPQRLLTPTFADALKEQLGDESRVVCLSLKDRSSVLPGGKRPDACYWFDKYGRVSTSTYYRDYPHDWVKEFNRAALVDQWHDKQWHRLRDDLNYTKYSGADDVKGESKGYAQGITFPHRFWDGPKKKRQNYYEAVECSPAGNELLLTLAKKAIEAEKLGQRDQPDFLSISFSSNDLVGHAWGPDSQEVLDITLRTDLLVKELLTFLDAKVGKGKYALAMTADHGICPLPEVSRSKGFPARRVDHDKLMRQAEEFLDHSFPPDNLDTYGKGKWIESHNLMLYLNHKRMKLRGVNSLQVETALSNWMLERNGIEVATTRSAILLEQVKGDIGERIVKSFVADRSGDVMLVPKMYCLITTSTTGTTHGSPYPYDTHVPLMILGPGIKAGLHKERVSPGLMPVLLARATQIQPPKQAEAKIPPGVFD